MYYIYKCTHHGNALAFVQTTKWMKRFHHEHGDLLGVIHLHDITAKRGTRPTVDSIKILKENICGETFIPNITLVSNMWSKPEQDIELFRENDLERNDVYWASLRANGAKMRRYHSHDCRLLNLKSPSGVNTEARTKAEKCGYPLVRNGFLSPTKAAAMYMREDPSGLEATPLVDPHPSS